MSGRGQLDRWKSRKTWSYKFNTCALKYTIVKVAYLCYNNLLYWSISPANYNCCLTSNMNYPYEQKGLPFQDDHMPCSQICVNYFLPGLDRLLVQELAQHKTDEDCRYTGH